MILRAVILPLVRAALDSLLTRPGKFEALNLGVKKRWIQPATDDYSFRGC